MMKNTYLYFLMPKKTGKYCVMEKIIIKLSSKFVRYFNFREVGCILYCQNMTELIQKNQPLSKQVTKDENKVRTDKK